MGGLYGLSICLLLTKTAIFFLVGMYAWPVADIKMRAQALFGCLPFPPALRV